MRILDPVNLLMLEQTDNSQKRDDPGTPSYNTARNYIIYSETPTDHKYVVYTFGAIVSENSSIMGNRRYQNNPGFTDIAGGDYTLKSNSRVFRDLPTFRQIDISEIGVHRS